MRLAVVVVVCPEYLQSAASRSAELKLIHERGSAAAASLGVELIPVFTDGARAACIESSKLLTPSGLAGALDAGGPGVVTGVAEVDAWRAITAARASFELVGAVASPVACTCVPAVGSMAYRSAPCGCVCG
jgi:hypothetical protein